MAGAGWICRDDVAFRADDVAVHDSVDAFDDAVRDGAVGHRGRVAEDVEFRHAADRRGLVPTARQIVACEVFDRRSPFMEIFLELLVDGFVPAPLDEFPVLVDAAPHRSLDARGR